MRSISSCEADMADFAMSSTWFCSTAAPARRRIPVAHSRISMDSSVLLMNWARIIRRRFFCFSGGRKLRWIACIWGEVWNGWALLGKWIFDCPKGQAHGGRVKKRRVERRARTLFERDVRPRVPQPDFHFELEREHAVEIFQMRATARKCQY